MAATLLGEWGFLDNYKDTSGNDRHGTVTGTPTFVTGPQTGTKGLKWNSLTDSVNFGRTGLEPSLEGITVMGWVRMEGNPAAATNILIHLCSKMRAASSSRSRIGFFYTSATNIRQRGAVARWKDALVVSDTGVTWTDDNWHHLAIVDGNNRYAFYHNGIQESSTARALGTGANTAWENFPWRTGFNPDDPADDRAANPGASVSGIRIFQGELTTAEVNTWMNTPITAVADATKFFALLA